ncbi:hypothetical protein [Actinomadura sp. HBU206391]|uniref:hypothetical protein n=1 Tax=Actinomadura sp. HBU206391 TaxID=2731692 RepID=UPI0016509DAE|nr:hypothetical protein [Actinomadura sp. HBU206391]MBC6458074.1 hypothetical protein [Actinomadura sp. HBU206391]
MTSTLQVKEEFYLRRAFDDDAPVFVDATRHARQGLPYPLSAKKALKATCAVWTDDDVVAFSLRDYTAKQAEREVEHVESSIGVKTITTRNVLRPRMPRKTLQDLNETARALSAVIGDDVIVELDGGLYVLALTRTDNKGKLRLVGRLAKAENGYVQSEITDADSEFELPIQGLRLRVFLRSPVRQRVLAYGFGGYLTRKPGEVETVSRATALALHSLLGLATFRMLSGLDHVEVPARPGGTAIRQRRQAGRVAFTVPVLLFTGDGTPAARGHVAGEIRLDQVDPVTGGLRLHLGEGDRLEWNPAMVGLVRFETYERVLTEAIAELIHSHLGADAVRDIAYDIALDDLGHVAVAILRAATADLPGLAATPSQAEVRPLQPGTTQPAL